jgi:hypothetical protein
MEYGRRWATAGREKRTREGRHGPRGDEARHTRRLEAEGVRLRTRTRTVRGTGCDHTFAAEARGLGLGLNAATAAALPASISAARAAVGRSSERRSPPPSAGARACPSAPALSTSSLR